MTKWMIGVVIAAMAIGGCGSTEGKDASKKDSASSKKSIEAVAGTYIFEMTPDVKKQLEQNAARLETDKQKAAQGDQAAKAEVARLGSENPNEQRLLEGMKLVVSKDGSFTMGMPDASTGKIREAKGTCGLDDSGTKLTLTITDLDGKKAEGSDAKAISLTFDDKEHTVTGEPGGGAKFVMKRR